MLLHSVISWITAAKSCNNLEKSSATSSFCFVCNQYLIRNGPTEKDKRSEAIDPKQ